MAHLLLPLNGVGRGHLTRALIFCEWLREAGRLPMVALQGASSFAVAPSVPTTNLPPLYQIRHTSPESHQSIASDLANVARLSHPSIIIEDTHLARARWPNDILHVLVVRPTSIDHMRRLNQHRGDTSARVLVCDDPTSPTWPYCPAETKEILSWPNWHILGPVFRTPTVEKLNRSRAKYQLRHDEKLFVFSMGGGGEAQGSGDRAAFIEAVNTIAHQLRQRLRKPRFIFVRGPLFPVDLALPEGFEDVAEEPDLPSLLGVAWGAVVRPGYNVTWECIASGTPFIALQGTTSHEEPTQLRLKALAARGIDTSLDVHRLLDPIARTCFDAACRAVLENHSGSPRELFLTYIEPPQPPAENPVSSPKVSRNTSFEDESLRQLASVIRGAQVPVPLRIRFDDVTQLDTVTLWFIALCCELGAKLSLEIVPYHNAITEHALAQLDPDGAIDIGQHGYAHLPEYAKARLRGEFIERSSEVATEQLRLGMRLLSNTFGRRFRRGYSAPYDVPPRWLAATWVALGGRYASWVYRQPDGAQIPTIRLGVDPWDWKAGKTRSMDQLVDQILTTMPRDNGIGLVFHPACLRDESHRRTATDLLGCLMSAGCLPTRIDPGPAGPI